MTYGDRVTDAVLAKHDATIIAYSKALQAAQGDPKEIAAAHAAYSQPLTAPKREIAD